MVLLYVYELRYILSCLRRRRFEKISITNCKPDNMISENAQYRQMDAPIGATLQNRLIVSKLTLSGTERRQKQYNGWEQEKPENKAFQANQGQKHL